MPKQLNNGRITDSLQRAFGFKGRYQPMLDEVVVPVYQIADPAPAAPIRSFLGNASVDLGAQGAGESPRFRFLNPGDSGVIVVITSLSVGILGSGGAATGSTGAEIYYAATSSLSNIAIIRPRDTRGRVGNAAVLTFDSAVVGAASAFGRTIIRADENEQELVGVSPAQARQPFLTMRPGLSWEVVIRGGALPTGPVAGFTALLNCGWTEIPVNQQSPASGLL